MKNQWFTTMWRIIITFEWFYGSIFELELVTKNEKKNNKKNLNLQKPKKIIFICDWLQFQTVLISLYWRSAAMDSDY